jgi:hypothetical protein
MKDQAQILGSYLKEIQVHQGSKILKSFPSSNQIKETKY